MTCQLCSGTRVMIRTMQLKVGGKHLQYRVYEAECVRCRAVEEFKHGVRGHVPNRLTN